jgi:acylphosphatase
VRAADERLEAVVHGRVQGVGFRVFVRRNATGLGLTGWVANEPGHRVRCVAEGPRRDLEALLEHLEAGPPGASVDRVDATWSRAAGAFSTFEVRAGSHSGD